MGQFLICCLLVMLGTVVAAMTPSYSGFGDNGYGGYGGYDGNGGYEGHGGSVPYYSYHDLLQLEHAFHTAANENIVVRQRMDMLAMHKRALDAKLKEVLADQFEDVSDQHTAQVGRIKAIADSIKSMLHRVGDLEARLSSAMVISRRAQSNLQPIRTEIDAFVTGSNIVQSSQLSHVNTTLLDSTEKLEQKLADRVKATEDAICAVAVSVDDAAEFLKTRKCFQGEVHIEINGTTKDGTGALVFPANFFLGNVPTVHCGIVGITGKLGKHHEGPPGYGYSYEPERESTAISLDCKGFEDKVTVTAFDKSNGHGNSILTLYVEIRACTIAAQSGF